MDKLTESSIKDISITLIERLGYDYIVADEVLYDAALRNLQTLSEATQLLPDDRKAAYPDIPWREISGFRNILVHNYLGDIDPLTVSAVIDKNLPALEESIRAMLAQDHGNGNDQAH